MSDDSEHIMNGREALELLASTCSSGTCPTVYRTARGSIVVQGREVDAAEVGATLAPGEALVEVPADLLDVARVHAQRIRESDGTVSIYSPLPR